MIEAGGIEALELTGSEEVPVSFAEAVKLGQRGGAHPGAGRPKKDEAREAKAGIKLTL